ncbi:hypothetical protein ACPV5G_19435 [Photobacterium damselae]|uniref:hypothetical protein n=1 Tax=Photobacterium damselae TaxID=38293 RepID=UPI0040693A69
MSSKFFPHNKSFLSLPILWVVICIHLGLAIGLFIIICRHTPLYLDFSSNGLNRFISIFRFPLGILSLIIPIMALLATNHRSEQTREQIRLSQEQNIFQNHYKHIEEFTKHCDTKLSSGIINPRHIYNNLYPKSSFGDFQLDIEFIFEMENLLVNSLKNINSIFSPHRNIYDASCPERKNGFKDCKTDLFTILEKISMFTQWKSDFEKNIQQYLIITENTHGFIINNIKLIASDILISLTFNPIHQHSSILSDLSNIKLNDESLQGRHQYIDNLLQKIDTDRENSKI